MSITWVVETQPQEGDFGEVLFGFLANIFFSFLLILGNAAVSHTNSIKSQIIKVRQLFHLFFFPPTVATFK